MPNEQKKTQLYDVTVGHIHVRVRSSSRKEAVKEARSKLCHEMPRFWDTIGLLEPGCFQVEKIS